MTNKQDEYFLEISNNPLDFLSQYIAPYLIGREWYWIRRALLLILVTHEDNNIRNRLHMLLSGPPGFGKTEFLLWIKKYFNAMMINAELTSKVGLTGDARGSKIKPGLLAECDKNLLLVDELDKMSIRDQNGLLQAMEEGGYNIVKGRNREHYTAEIRVIGTTNSLKPIQKPLLDRFDFIFYVNPSTRNERADNLDKIISEFLDGNNKQQNHILSEYINWLNDYNLSVTSDIILMIKNILFDYINTTNTYINYVSYRSLELSILRIAYAMAKLEKTTINSKHIKDAVWLKDQILKNIVGEYTWNKYKFR